MNHRPQSLLLRSSLPLWWSPDAKFRQALDIAFLSTRTGAPISALEAFLDRIDGEEDHDWVNKLANHFGRVLTLTALADSWVEDNTASADEFVRQLHDKTEFLLHSTQVKVQEAMAAAEEESRFASRAATVPTSETTASSGSPA